MTDVSVGFAAFDALAATDVSVGFSAFDVSAGPPVSGSGKSHAQLQAQRLEVMAHYERLIAEREARQKQAEEEAKPAIKPVKVAKAPVPKKVVAAVRDVLPVESVSRPVPVIAETSPAELALHLHMTTLLQDTARLVQAQQDAERRIKEIDRQIRTRRQQKDVELVLLLAA